MLVFTLHWSCAYKLHCVPIIMLAAHPVAAAQVLAHATDEATWNTECTIYNSDLINYIDKVIHWDFAAKWIQMLDLWFDWQAAGLSWSISPLQ